MSSVQKSGMPTSTWDTKEWREKRAKLIDDHCGACGTTEGPMVLQHTWHPTGLKRLEGQLRYWYTGQYAIQFGWPPLPADRTKAARDAYDASMREFKQAVEDLGGWWIRQEAKAEYDRQMERYLSCEDTVTRCKRCAFREDAQAGRIRHTVR